MVSNDDLREEIVQIYRKRAENYDITANLYYLIGYPEWRYRRYTIDRLDLEPGDTVVEIGCGTGLNFSLVEERIGETGTLIGVDLTDAMLEKAQQRVESHGWKNVDLVRQDAAEYVFPEGVNAIYSTFALSLIPEGPDIIRRGAQALSQGGRWSLFDFEIPGKWPDWLVSAMMTIIKPFTPTDDWMARKPWPGIKDAFHESLQDVVERKYYLGTSYLISGEAGLS